MDLLLQFQHILESDPLIDEVGFVHPTQFAMLAEDSTGDAAISDGTTFWSRDHKLGVSTQAILPLYNAAKRAFIAAMEEYKRLGDCDDGLESEVMGCIVRLSCCSAPISALPGTQVYLFEFLIKSRSKMNYRAWNHHCWLVSYMTREQRLMLRILKDSTCKLENASPGWVFFSRSEALSLASPALDFDSAALAWETTSLMQTLYIGEPLIVLNPEIGGALWLHCRFLSLCWMKQFASNLHDVSCHSELKISTSNSFNSFIDNELHLLNSCSTIPDNDFEDFQVQVTYFATYILWLTKIFVIASANPGVLVLIPREAYNRKSEDYAEQGVPRKVIPLGFFNRLDGNA
ncbi:hypothetical protein CFP56_022812 [Quercus suber]|uniref:Uncharacterized protein n=1 Tax=Quercus suber TaxID=58331 RepID=A0AAW0KAR5_QUESU